MSQTQAGWVADPTGRHELRYWDGSQWTEHVSNGGVPASDSLVLPPPGELISNPPPARARIVETKTFLAESMGLNAQPRFAKFHPVEVVVGEQFRVTGKEFGTVTCSPDDVLGVSEVDIPWGGTGIGLKGLARKQATTLMKNNAAMARLIAPGVVVETSDGDIGLFFSGKDAASRRQLHTALCAFAGLEPIRGS